MSALGKYVPPQTKQPKRTELLHKQWMDFNLNYFDVIPPQKHIYSSHRSDTSDETKRLETRPNKLESATNFSIIHQDKIRNHVQ